MVVFMVVLIQQWLRCKCNNREGYWMRKIAINQKRFPTMVNVYGCRCVLKSHYEQSGQPQSNKMHAKKNYWGCQILGRCDVHESLNENDIGEEGPVVIKMWESRGGYNKSYFRECDHRRSLLYNTMLSLKVKWTPY